MACMHIIKFRTIVYVFNDIVLICTKVYARVRVTLVLRSYAIYVWTMHIMTLSETSSLINVNCSFNQTIDEI